VRLLPASKSILRVLDICPWVPIDVLVPLAGARTRVSAYQALARLRAAELVQVRRVPLGPLAGDRPLGLWATTEQGRQALARAAPASPDETIAQAKLLLGAPDRHTRPAVRDPLRVAAARGLAAMFVSEATLGRRLELGAWEAPWIRTCTDETSRVARLPAAAVVESVGEGGTRCMELVVVVPDLGTAPIVRYREMLRRLTEIPAEAYTADIRGLPRLLIVTTNLDRRAARGCAWRQLVRRISEGAGLQPPPISLVEWQQVSTLLGGIRVPGGRGHPDVRGHRRAHPRGRMRQEDQVLDVLGRHPFLTVEQIADLLAMGPHRVRELRGSLAARGLIHVIPPEELNEARSGLRPGGPPGLDVAELTASGRRQLARMLGLPAAAAQRHHGLSVGSARHRRRALRSLAHTLGANDVFVSLAVAARAARSRGTD
jgi:DNA-binding PadR family transcriptional regulator